MDFHQNGSMQRPLTPKSWTLADIAKEISAELVGDGAVIVTGLATLASAKAGQISFLANSSYRRQLPDTNASAVIVNEDSAADCKTNALVCANPYLAYAKLSHCFDQAPVSETGVHSTAFVHKSVQMGTGVSIGANAVVEQGVTLGAHVVIGPGSVVAGFATIGDHSVIHANVTIYHHVIIGMRVNIHSGAVIGADGFGFASEKGSWKKIAQLGSVFIGDDVDIGANSAVDRGALDDTIIGNGVIIDNLVQLAHNVKVGDHTAIAGCVGVAGSSEIGRYCTIAGAAGIAGHLTICDRVHIGMQAQVTNSISEPGIYASGTGLMPVSVWRRNVARLRRLNEFYYRLVKLEREK